MSVFRRCWLWAEGGRVELMLRLAMGFLVWKGVGLVLLIVVIIISAKASQKEANDGQP